MIDSKYVRCTYATGEDAVRTQDINNTVKSMPYDYVIGEWTPGNTLVQRIFGSGPITVTSGDTINVKVVDNIEISLTGSEDLFNGDYGIINIYPCKGVTLSGVLSGGLIVFVYSKGSENVATIDTLSVSGSGFLAVGSVNGSLDIDTRLYYEMFVGEMTRGSTAVKTFMSAEKLFLMSPVSKSRLSCLWRSRSKGITPESSANLYGQPPFNPATVPQHYRYAAAYPTAPDYPLTIPYGVEVMDVFTDYENQVFNVDMSCMDSNQATLLRFNASRNTGIAMDAGDVKSGPDSIGPIFQFTSNAIIKLIRKNGTKVNVDLAGHTHRAMKRGPLLLTGTNISVTLNPFYWYYEGDEMLINGALYTHFIPVYDDGLHILNSGAIYETTAQPTSLVTISGTCTGNIVMPTITTDMTVYLSMARYVVLHAYTNAKNYKDQDGNTITGDYVEVHIPFVNRTCNAIREGIAAQAAILLYKRKDIPIFKR